MPTVVRTLIAAFLALAGPVLAAPAVQAHAQEIQQQSSRTDAAASHRLSISIDAVSPNFATPNKTVTVRGTLTNHTGSAIAGMVVQLFTSPVWFIARSSMDSFASGSSAYLPEQAGMTYALSGVLAKGATVRWKVSFSPAQAASFTPVQAGYPQAGYTHFGVYPLEAEAVSLLGTQHATSRTFLPFWPGNGSAKPLDTAWIWPLIDQPQQDVCGQSQAGATMTLATNSLADSLGSGGRLGTLLATGERWARQDQLTWAVDPALLSDASAMTHPYTVGGNVGSDATCTGRAPEPASTAARKWLSELHTGTANEPMFATPYADVDVSALSHAGLDADLHTAYQLGESVARKILSRPFGKNGQGTGVDGAPAVAWPADGTADASVVTSLASNGINTVVLNSGELPSTDGQVDNALGSTTTGTGTMPVLLADSRLTRILGSASAGSSAATQFAAEQDFLAQTAMISAELPQSTRSLVIAPPRRWDPSAPEAKQLLSLTFKAPWLHTVALSSLATAAGKLTSRETLPGNQVTRAELHAGYLSQVKTVDANVALYKDLQHQPSANLPQSLDAAVAVTESTAWRGANAGGGWLALDKLAAYLTDAENNVRNLTGTKVLLAGSSGDIPVSVQNLNPYPVQVEVKTTLPANSQLSVGKFNDLDLIKVPAGGTVTAKLPMHSAGLGTTTMQLQLATKDGSPLTWTTQSLSVQATRYGQALLVLIGAALGVLVLTSVARWIRRWLNDRKADGRSGGTG